MRKRIQQLARGKFEYARPLLSFSTDKVTIEVLEGKDYTGDFVITSTNRVPMRGVIYTSDPRIECLNPQFEGEEVRIRYQFHSNGLAEGDIHKGEFFVICNQCEYNLSFVASISKLYADSSVGKIKNLSDFVRLAKENFEESYHLFYSPNFKNIIKAGEIKERLLYEGLSKGAVSMQKVEEFLIGINKKKPVSVTVLDEVREFYDVTESLRENIEIRRNQPGYVEIAVTSDADFLVPSKEHLTEEDFMGSVCVFPYYIQAEHLHAGKNFGCLTFCLPKKVVHFTVCASQRNKKEEGHTTEHLEIKENKIRLMQLYLDYRLKKIVTGAWANQSIAILDHLMAMGQKNPIYPLMKAQALLINRQRQEASWIMEDFKREWTKQDSAKQDSPVWGYYLYLCTLVEREPSYVDRITMQIEELFRRNPDSSLLFWILLFVREDYYRNNVRRLRAIEQWISRGNYSPYFYMEAYYLIWQDPYLLGRLDSFEIQVLNWARKQGAISKDIAIQVMNIVAEQREFHPFVYRILEACYAEYPEDELLAVICGYLIKGQRFDKCYHGWYELGIEHEIRITNLYEAYLMSLDGRRIERVPKMIQMYFQYNSNISYQQRAILFVNIIAEKNAQPEVYQKYRRTMEQFAMEQIEAGHISDNLAVVYDEMLRVGILNEELAQRLSDILFTHRLTCLDTRIARAMILHRQLKRPQEVVFSNGEAYFQAYTDDYCVILEDNQGQRYAKSVFYRDEALMKPQDYLEKCQELAPQKLPYILYRFRGKHSWKDFFEQDSRYFSALLQSEQVSDSYKAVLLPEIIRYYQKKTYDSVNGNKMLEKYLSMADYGLLATDARRYLMQILTELHQYEKAYWMVQAFGYDYMDGAARVLLCSYAVTKAGFEEDDFLLGFVESTFLLGKYNDIMLIYLCKYYNGATKIMAELWKAAGEFEIDTFDLEERILTQMLYTTDYTPYVEEIYDSYYAGGGRELVCLAYLSYFSNSYLVRDALVPEHVFGQIKERYLQEKELNDACCLGLLKYFALNGMTLESERVIADQLLQEYTGRNIYFAFYRKLGNSLTMKYHFYDKYFVEYHTRPGIRVRIHYCDNADSGRMEETYCKEDMAEVYDGIYVKEFVLFFGEAVQYYITEEENGAPRVTESNRIQNHDVLENEKHGRYARLNEMLIEGTLQDKDQLKCHMKNYYGMQQVTEKVFRLL